MTTTQPSVARPIPRTSCLRTKLRTLFALVVAASALAAIWSATARADAPWWRISSETSPTNIAPGSEGILFLHASDLADTTISSSTEPIVIKAVLPAGVVATSIAGNAKGDPPASCSLANLECSLTGVINPYEPATVTVRLTSDQPSGTVDTLHGQAIVTGGGAASTSAAAPIPINGTPAPFGLEALRSPAVQRQRHCEHPGGLSRVRAHNHSCFQPDWRTATSRAASEGSRPSSPSGRARRSERRDTMHDGQLLHC